MRLTQCMKIRVITDSHHTMGSQCVITSIVNEFHPMITLEQNKVFRNKNLLYVSLQRIILLTKHVYFSHTFLHFHGLSPLELCITNIPGLSPEGYLSLLATTRHKFSCSANSGTPLNFVQRYLTHSSTTKYGV